jgi:hypothetical protein
MRLIRLSTIFVLSELPFGSCHLLHDQGVHKPLLAGGIQGFGYVWKPMSSVLLFLGSSISPFNSILGKVTKPMEPLKVFNCMVRNDVYFGVTDLDSWCQHAIAFWAWKNISSNDNQLFGHLESEAWQRWHPHGLRASTVNAHLVVERSNWIL